MSSAMRIRNVGEFTRRSAKVADDVAAIEAHPFTQAAARCNCPLRPWVDVGDDGSVAVVAERDVNVSFWRAAFTGDIHLWQEPFADFGRPSLADLDEAMEVLRAARKLPAGGGWGPLVDSLRELPGVLPDIIRAEQEARIVGLWAEASEEATA